ncbi:MAG TPA: acyl-homoserine-lactone synthase [Sphingomicrobium sp.]|nr:acyl-homoserine-lactone synthase [Sphingomicrobium sp.]
MATIVEAGCLEPCSDRTLRAMFEDRKSVFVDLLKWDLPVLHGRFELDDFDDSRATYVIIADGDGDHLGSARLLPTTRPHILDSLFAHLCAAPAPIGSQVFEITRFCLSRRQNAASRRRTRNQLVTALAWHALESGIQTYTGVAELAWLQQILAFGWDCRPLGVPARLECGMIGALAIEIRSDTPELLAGNGVWDFEGEPFLPVAKAA